MPPPQTQGRWHRFRHWLLYGHGVDRSVKARARLGLAILVFAAVYGVIAFRLVMFATAGDSHAGRRTVPR